MIVKTTGHVLSLRPLAGGRERRIYSYIIHNLSPPSWDLPNLEQPDGVNCPQKDPSTHLANLLQNRDSKFSATYSVSKMFWHLIYWHWWYCLLYIFTVRARSRDLYTPSSQFGSRNHDAHGVYRYSGVKINLVKKRKIIALYYIHW